MIDIELPAMGEGITGATISKWLVKPGDRVEEEDPVVEVATDKVDSEVIAPVSGVIENLYFKEGDEVSIGEVVANMKGESDSADEKEPAKDSAEPVIATEKADMGKPQHHEAAGEEQAGPGHGFPGIPAQTPSGKYLSPLVRNIAAKEGVTTEELEGIVGTGLNARITKDDLFLYITKQRPEKEAKTGKEPAAPEAQEPGKKIVQPETPQPAYDAYQGASNYEIVKMDRMRKLIAQHMVTSKQSSPHVTSFIEVDVSDLVEWRNSIKNSFLKQYGEKLTFTPIFIDAAVKALKDFPMVNVSVDGEDIIVKKDINIGMATALPNGNLIVPVIRNAETKNMLGLAKSVNDLAARARNNKLKPDEIKGGTFTITNLGNFGNMTGTPIINQPEAAILALGAITKKPAVIETPKGDTVGIRRIMVLSMSYDHRVVDGALGGMFLKRVAEYLENFDTNQSV